MYAFVKAGQMVYASYRQEHTNEREYVHVHHSSFLAMFALSHEQIIKTCQEQFGIRLLCDLIPSRTEEIRTILLPIEYKQ